MGEDLLDLGVELDLDVGNGLLDLELGPDALASAAFVSDETLPVCSPEGLVFDLGVHLGEGEDGSRLKNLGVYVELMSPSFLRLELTRLLLPEDTLLSVSSRFWRLGFFNGAVAGERGE